MTTALRRRSAASLIIAASALLVTATAVSVPAAATAAPPSYSITDRIPIADPTDGVAVNSNTNTVYVGTKSGVLVVNGATGVVTTTVPTSAAITSIDLNPVTNTVYAATLADTIVAVNGRTNNVTATIPVPRLQGHPGNTGIAVDAGTNKVYAGSWDKALSVIDGTTNTVTATVPYQLDSSESTGSGAVAVDPTTHTIYALTQNNMNVISGTTNAVTTTVPVTYGSFALASQRVGVDTQSHTIYATGGDGHVYVIDGVTNTIIRTFQDGAIALAVDSGAHAVYLAFFSTWDTMSVLDSATGTEVAKIPFAPYLSGPLAVNSATHAVYTVATVFSNDAQASQLTVINGPAPRCPLVEGAIGVKYGELGGCDGFLGKATSAERPVTGGAYTSFEGGDIYWSPETGAHVIKGAIAATWRNLGAERSVLGFPTTDELTTPDTVGRYNHFQGGSIYFTPQTGAHEIYGSIRSEWAAQGYELSGFGYPTTGEFDFLFGRLSLFQRGFIYYNPAIGIIPFHW